MSVKHNAYQVAARIEALGPGLEKAMADALDVQAQEVMRMMKRESPKFQNVLTNSVHVEKPTALSRLIAPDTNYAEAVHKGVKPGKGLPRFNDPRAGDIIAWLQSTAFASVKKPRKGSKGAVLQNLELRDRYQGLSWHVRHFGTQANPFVARTHEAAAGTVVAALKAAALKALGGGNGGIGGTALA